MKINEKITGMAILILSILSSSIEGLFPKHLLNFIKKNQYIKHIILLFFVYFLLDFSDPINQNPLYNLVYTFFVYILFILFTNQGLFISILIIILIFISYFSYTYKDFLVKKNNNGEIEIVKNIDNVNNIIYIIIISLLIFGTLYKKFAK